MQQCVLYGCGTFTLSNSSDKVSGYITYSTINMGMNGSNIKLVYDNTTSLNSRIEGLNINALNWGTSTQETIDIRNHPLNSTYALNIAKNSEGAIKVWCDADLIK